MKKTYEAPTLIKREALSAIAASKISPAFDNNHDHTSEPKTD